MLFIFIPSTITHNWNVVDAGNRFMVDDT